MRHLLLPVALGVVIVAGCSPADTPAAPSADHVGHASTADGLQFAALAPAYQKQLAAVRASNSRLKTPERGVAAGYVAQVTECRDNPPVGGMGFHYLNPGRITDSPVAEEPQILVYAPKNGTLQLGAVEYIVPYALVPADAPPPVLLGQQFHHNDGDGVWMLHVWLWRHNPDGIFADWNPTVSCP